MAITLIVEDGSIVPDANSYLSVEEATTILSVDFRKAPEWEALTDAEKELMLTSATRYLDDNYQWYGRRVSAEQPLLWPRLGMRDCEKQCLSSTTIPSEVKKAVAYLALWLRKNDGEEVMNSDGVKRFRSEEVEIEWQEGFMGRKAPEFLAKFLICLGLGPNDRGFKPIIRK